MYAIERTRSTCLPTCSSMGIDRSILVVIMYSRSPCRSRSGLGVGSSPFARVLKKISMELFIRKEDIFRSCALSTSAVRYCRSRTTGTKYLAHSSTKSPTPCLPQAPLKKWQKDPESEIFIDRNVNRFQYVLGLDYSSSSTLGMERSYSQ